MSYSCSESTKGAARTIVIAAFVARILGLARSALGGGGGLAATCGDAASADKSLGECAFVAGMTTGGVSPKVGLFCGNGGALDEPGENADIMACRCIGVQIECEDDKCEARSRDAC